MGAALGLGVPVHERVLLGVAVCGGTLFLSLASVSFVWLVVL